MIDKLIVPIVVSQVLQKTKLTDITGSYHDFMLIAAIHEQLLKVILGCP